MFPEMCRTSVAHGIHEHKLLTPPGFTQPRGRKVVVTVVSYFFIHSPMVLYPDAARAASGFGPLPANLAVGAHQPTLYLCELRKFFTRLVYV
jgi:hypothetical protein